MTKDEYTVIDEHYVDADWIVCTVCEKRCDPYNTRDTVFTFEHLERKVTLNICNDCMYNVVEKLIKTTGVGVPERRLIWKDLALGKSSIKLKRTGIVGACTGPHQYETDVDGIKYCKICGFCWKLGNSLTESIQ